MTFRSSIESPNAQHRELCTCSQPYLHWTPSYSTDISLTQSSNTIHSIHTRLIFNINTKMSVTLYPPLPLTQPPPQCQSLETTPAALPPSQPGYSLDDLVRDIKAHLGESSGIGCPDVDEEYLMALAAEYKSNPNDWARYYYNCPGKNYTRNAIENINNKANIVGPSQLIIEPPLLMNNVVAPRLGSRQRLPHPRPRRRALHSQGPRRRADRDCLSTSPGDGGRGAPAGAQEPDDASRRRGDVYQRHDWAAPRA